MEHSNTEHNTLEYRYCMGFQTFTNKLTINNLQSDVYIFEYLN